MTKPLVLTLGCGWCTLFPGAWTACAAPEPPVRPNIIVVFTDDQTFRGIGYENAEVKTPQLDSLSAGGIRFRNCYAASPICAASRASLMTGRFPQQHGVTGLNSQAFRRYRKGGSQADQSLAVRAAAAGYNRACPRSRDLLKDMDLSAEKRRHESLKRLPCLKFGGYDFVITPNQAPNRGHTHLPTRPSSSTSLRLWSPACCLIEADTEKISRIGRRSPVASQMGTPWRQPWA